MADLYIVHGWTYTVEPWKKTIALLRDNGISVKMLHVPGLTEESKKEFTIYDYMKWADREIPDGAVALGHSNGGRILLNLCAQKSEKLKYLILLDSAGIYEPSTRKKLVEKAAKLGKPLKKVKLIDPSTRFSIQEIRLILHFYPILKPFFQFSNLYFRFFVIFSAKIYLYFLPFATVNGYLCYNYDKISLLTNLSQSLSHQ